MGEITYRIARDDDRTQIIELLNEVFSGQQRSDRVRDDASWKWKNKENVFDTTRIVVADHEGDIIGTGTLWPFNFKLNGKVYPAYQTCGLAVSEHFRRRGVFRNINRVRIETAKAAGASFLFSFPNSKSLPGYKKMGWSTLGKLKWYVKPIRPFQILNDLIFQNEPSIPVRPEKPLMLQEGQIRYRRISGNDDILRLNKNERYFNWRYANHPYFSYGFIKYEEDEDFTYGAVFSILQKGRFREMVIIDIISRNFEMTQCIIKKAEEVARRYRVMYLAMVAPEGSSTLTMTMPGYLPYKMKNLAVYTLEPSIRKTVENINRWSLFAGLHDSI